MDFELVTTDIDISRLRLLNVYMLMKCYCQAGDHSRVVRFLSSNTEQNQYFADLLAKLSREANLSDTEIQNYVLFLLQIHGDSLMSTKEFKKASELYYLVCKVYNRWKVNNKMMDVMQMADATASDMTKEVCEFGVDDYIRTKASYAESIMNMGDV